MSPPSSLLLTFSQLTVAALLTIGLSACLTTSPASPVDPDAQRQTATPLAASFTRTYPFSVAHLGFANDGRQFFAALEHSRIDLFDSGNFKLQHTLDFSSSMLLGLGFIDGAHFYVGYHDESGRLKVYTVPQWQEVASYRFEHHRQVPIVANRNVAIYEETLLNWHTGQTFHANRQSHPGRGRVFLTADGHVVSPETNGWILVENPISGERTAWNAGDDRRVLFVSDTADGKHLITYAINGLCRVWRRGPVPTEVGRCGEATWQQGGMFMAPLLAHGHFATGLSKRVRVWELDRQTGHTELRFDVTAPAAVNAIALAPTRLALSTETGTIEVWDLAARALIGLYRPDEKIVQNLKSLGGRIYIGNLAFSPDGRLLLASVTNHLVALPLPE